MLLFYKYFSKRPFLYHLLLSLSIFLFIKQGKLSTPSLLIFSFFFFVVLFYLVRKIYESIFFHFFIKKNQKQVTRIFYFYSFLFFLLVPFSAVNYFFEINYFVPVLFFIFVLISSKEISKKLDFSFLNLIVYTLSTFLIISLSSLFLLNFFLFFL